MASESSSRILTETNAELSAYCDYVGKAVRNAALNLIHDMVDKGIDPKGIEGASMLRAAAIKAVRESTLDVREQVVVLSASYYDALNGTNSVGRADWSWANHEDAVMSDAVGYIDKNLEKLRDGEMSTSQFVQRCYDCGSTQVQRMHCSSLDSAMRRSGTYSKKERWARVPSGAETCGFCIMLGSRGFVYRSAMTAGAHYHANCDCMISNKPVSGYSPKKLEEQWRASETERILRDGYKGTAKAKVEEIRKKYPEGYEQWADYCSREHSVNKGAQRVHIYGTNEYFTSRSSRDMQPSYFALSEEDVFRLVEKSIGYGWPGINEKTGKWDGMYYFTAARAVGIYAETDAFTRQFKVNCLSEKIHAYPTFDRRLEPDET